MARDATSFSLPLEQAFATLSQAVSRVEHSLSTRRASARSREDIQAEITASWQQHSASIESARDALEEENRFLKEDNMRLSNQLQALQQEYMSLQEAAKHTVSRLDGSVKQLDMLMEH